MIRILLTKYWVLVHLLLVAGTLCFAPAPSVGFGLWAAASLLLMALCLPPVFRGEGFWLARRRVAQAMRGDVVAWSALLCVAYVGVGLINGPRAFGFEPELLRWVYAPPRMPAMPSSIDPAEGVPFFVGLLCALACAVAVRAALPRGQRLYALIGLGLLTGALALVGAGVALATGGAPAFGWLGGRFSASTLWLLMFCVSLGIVGEMFLEGRLWPSATALAAACLNEMALFAFGTPLMAGLAALVAVVWLLFAAFAVRACGRGLPLLWNTVLMTPVVFSGLVGFTLLPGAAAVWEGVGQASLSAGWEAFLAQWPFRAGLALEVLGRNPMLGVGPEGFAHTARFYVEGSLAWGLWREGGAGVPCDFLKLLCERGLIGTLLLLIPGFAMLGRCLMCWVEFRQNRRRHYSLRYVFVLVGSLLGVVFTLGASFVGTPLHGPAALCAFLIVCACMGGWMPRPR